MADESFDRLLRRRMREDERPGDCPEPAMLAAFADRTLSRLERESVQSHASSCSRCAAELALILETAPATDRAPDRTARPWWHWRWAVPVATAIVVFGVWSETERRSEQKAAVHSDAPVVIGLNNGAQQQAAGDAAAAVSRDEERQETQALGGSASMPTAAPLPPSRRDARPPAEPPPAPKAQADREFLRLKEAPQGGLAPDAEAPRSHSRRIEDQVPPADLTANTALRDAPPETDASGLRVGAPPASSPAAPPPPAASAAASAEAAPFASQELRKSARAEESSGMPVVSGPGSLRVRVTAAGIERSVDGGASWTLEHAMPALPLFTGSCPDVETCWVGGEAGLVLRREASGRWVNVSIPGGTAIRRLEGIDAGQATATMDGGRRVRTGDGGRTWVAVP